MAKSLRSKFKRKMRAIKRERIAKRILQKLIAKNSCNGISLKKYFLAFGKFIEFYAEKKVKFNIHSHFFDFNQCLRFKFRFIFTRVNINEMTTFFFSLNL